MWQLCTVPQHNKNTFYHKQDFQSGSLSHVMQRMLWKMFSSKSHFHEYSHPNSLWFQGTEHGTLHRGGDLDKKLGQIKMFWINCLETPRPLGLNKEIDLSLCSNLTYFGVVRYSSICLMFFHSILVYGVCSCCICVFPLSFSIHPYPLLSVFAVHKCHGTTIV